AMLINGHNRLACQVLCKDLTQPITVEPLRGLKVEKDLIVDMEPFFAGYQSVLPWLIHDDSAGGTPVGGRERHQSPAERERYDDTTKCILCAACSTSCPIYWADQSYVGPAAIVNAHRFIFDSRDTGAAQRLELLTARQGVYRCRTTFNCTDACPRGIKVTEAIQEVKRAALFKKL
ncbi:MAG: succinate dehydrogenase iron-sulfur subunit, partial [Actinomycetota bacterium]